MRKDASNIAELKKFIKAAKTLDLNYEIKARGTFEAKDGDLIFSLNNRIVSIGNKYIKVDLGCDGIVECFPYKPSYSNKIEGYFLFRLIEK